MIQALIFDFDGLILETEQPEYQSWLGLDRHFLCVSCREDVVSGKPDPAVYLATLQRLGVEAPAAVALEDSPHGVLAAKRAGIFCIAVPSLLTRDLPFPDPDLVVDSLADLSLVELLASFQQQTGPVADLSPLSEVL